MKFAETKYITTADAGLALPFPASGSSVIPLVDIRQGTDIDERVGNEVQVSGVYIRIIYEAALTGTTQWMRALLYSPRVPGSVLPVVSNMVDQPDPDEFIIWFDRTALCTFTPGGGSGVMTIRKKFKPYMKTIFDTSLGPTQQKGQLILGLFGQNDLGTVLSYSARVYFKDV